MQGPACFVQETVSGIGIYNKNKKNPTIRYGVVQDSTRVHPLSSASLHAADIRVCQYFQFSFSALWESHSCAQKWNCSLFLCYWWTLKFDLCSVTSRTAPPPTHPQLNCWLWNLIIFSITDPSALSEVPDHPQRILILQAYWLTGSLPPGSLPLNQIPTHRSTRVHLAHVFTSVLLLSEWDLCFYDRLLPTPSASFA